MMMMNSPNQMSLRLTAVSQICGAIASAEDVAERVRQARHGDRLDLLELLRAILDLLVQEVQEEDQQERVEQHEHAQGCDDSDGAQDGRDAVDRPEDVVDHPWLPADLGRPPAGGDRRLT